MLVAQVKLIVGAAATENIAEQVKVAAQEEVTVHVTVFVPPQAGGAEPPLLVNDTLHPPVKVVVANHAEYAASITVCV